MGKKTFEALRAAIKFEGAGIAFFLAFNKKIEERSHWGNGAKEKSPSFEEERLIDV